MLEAVGADDVAESRAFNAELERLIATQPPVQDVPLALTRAARREGRGIFPAPVLLPQARDRIIEGRSGPIRLRVLEPAAPPRGIYLHLHGGGWTLGGADMQDLLLWELVEAAGVTAVSVDYRLAPEDPYPAGPDDCEDAARWLLAHASELGSDRLVIGGDSAGAQLAVVTLVRLRDGGPGTAAFRGANLVYGGFDLSMTPSQRLWGDRNLMLSEPIVRWFGECFTPGATPEERRNPDISPLYADLRGLPPALFTVGEVDPLIDDTLFMESRWRTAGNGAELRLWPESVHGFTAFPTRIARMANGAQHAFVASALEG